MKKIFSLFAAILFAGSMMAADALKATLLFNDSVSVTAWKIPATSEKGVDAQVFSDGTYSIKLEGTTGAGYRVYPSDANPYLILGKQGASLTLQAFDWKTTKIVVTGRAGASTAVKQNIYVGEVAASTETTGATGVNEYAIAADYQEAGNIYVLKVTSNHNTQITKIEIYGEGGDEPSLGAWSEIKFAAATAAGAFNDSVFAAGDFKLTCIDTDNSKIKTTANDAAFGDANEYAMYKFRLQTGGKSGSKNAMKLTIPGDGYLRIAVRTGSNDDVNRTVVLSQGTDTLYNKVVKEADAVEVPITDSTKLKVYPYIIVPVKKGEVSVGYPVNAVNFYSFAFLAGAAPEPVDTIPTTAPAAPKQAEKDVMGIYCNYYKENNLNFAISGWAGAYQTLDLQGTNVAYWKGMTWECIIDPAKTDSAHDFSAYENLHVDFWAPQAAKIKFTVEAVAGGNYKDGMVAELKQGWNCFDFELAKWTGAYDFKNVKCFVLEQYQTPTGESFEGNPFAVANIYFWNAPVVTDPTNCAEAREAALSVSANNELYNGGKEYTIEGYVTEIATAWSEQYKNITFWMADEKGGGQVLEAFRAACETAADAPAVNDKVKVTGKLTKYNTTPEFAAGCTVEIVERGSVDPVGPVVVADTLTVAKAIELGMKLDSMATDTVVYAVEGYVINAGSVSLTYMNQSWYMADEATAVASDFQAYNCYAIDGNDTLKVLNGDKVQLVGKLKKYYNKTEQKYIIEIEKGNASFISKTEGDHSIKVVTEEVTVAQALEIGAALADNAVTEKQYKITAYVSAVNVKSSDAYSDQYGNQSFWVADDQSSTASTNADGAFYVYRGKPSTAKEIALGSKVEFTCTIKKYVPAGGGDPVIENADQNILITVLEEPAGPELPDGVISCDSAVVLAKTIEDPVEVKSTVEGPAVKVWGYVTYAYNASEKDGIVKQSAWLSDVKDSNSGVIQGAYLEIASMESAVVKGDYVQIEGTLAKYLKEGKDGKPNEIVIEVINGKMAKVSELGIENIELTVKAQKVIVDGVLYIIRDNKMYNVQGLQVR